MGMYKLLIADDEHFIRSGINKLAWDTIDVSVCGIANNGKEAIEMADLYQPELILTDIRMPIVDGLDMAEKILSRNKKCKIIFLSGYEDFKYAKRALQMGAFDYILKPASPDVILECCRKAIRQIKTERSDFEIIEQYKRTVIESVEIKEEKYCRDIQKINIQEIQLYIETNYMDNLVLEQVSRKFNFNAIYINRMLKRETGFTFLEILNNKRMSVSLRLLEETDMKVGEIAEKVGIRDPRYFSTMFKKYYNCTPKQYRHSMK